MLSAITNKIDESRSTDEMVCPICRDECKLKDLVHFCSDETHGGFCGPCASDYIKFKIDASVLGFCPKISCPLEHFDAKPRILRYSAWKKSPHITSDIVTKYNALATSLLAFLCGGCHSLKSLSVSANNLTPEQIDAARTILNDKMASTGQDTGLFETELVQYCGGLSSVDDFYNRVTTTFLSSLVTADDRTAWSLFKNVLMLIEDPERQSNLHLRYLRSRPRMWTPCCNREHCFHCKTIDFHEGKTCSQNTATLDGSIVNCPSCGVAIAKGDGCNSMTCVCGKQFSWSTEKETQEKSRRFAQANPHNTAQRCVSVLCGKTQSQSMMDDARAWQSRHREEVNRELAKWWIKEYGQCPSQVCSIMDLRTASTGVKLAVELWTAGHAAEVKACKEKNDVAMRSLFTSLYLPRDRAAAAARLLTGHTGHHTIAKNERLWESARLWVNDHRDEYVQEMQMKEQKQCSQFLQLYGNRYPTNGRDETIPCAIEWDRHLSNSSLTFTNEDTTVQRVGSVSSYPAAFAVLPAERSMFSVVLDKAPRSSNWITFGLARSSFPITGSDGIGRTRDSWGLHDDRSSSSDAQFASCGAQQGRFRKLREGDILTAVVDTDEGLLKISVNETEALFELNFPPGDAADFVFAMTFANDHQVTLVTDEMPCGLSGDKSSAGSLNREHLKMKRALCKRLRNLYQSSQSAGSSAAAGGAVSGSGPKPSSSSSRPSSSSPAAAHGFHVGVNVTLAADFAQYSDAAQGPLQMGDTGVVASDGRERVNVRSEDGRTWWYDVQALLHALPALPKMTEVGECSAAMQAFVEDTAQLWVAKHGDAAAAKAAFVAQEEIIEAELRLAPSKPTMKLLSSFRTPRSPIEEDGAAGGGVTGRQSLRMKKHRRLLLEAEAKNHSHAIFCLACNAPECKLGIGPRVGFFKLVQRIPIAAEATPAQLEECIARQLRQYVIDRPGGDASRTWANFVHSLHSSIRVPSSVKAKKLCLAHPELLEWTQSPSARQVAGRLIPGSCKIIPRPPIATAARRAAAAAAAAAGGGGVTRDPFGGEKDMMEDVLLDEDDESTKKIIGDATLKAAEAGEGGFLKEAATEKAEEKKPQRLTWLEIASAVCWKKLHGESLQREKAEREEKERAAKDEELVMAFIAEHAESAAFVAASRLHGGGVGSARDREEAEAYARFLPCEMQGWYDYNAGLSEPMFGLERMARQCRCIPRHCGSSCPKSSP